MRLLIILVIGSMLTLACSVPAALSPAGQETGYAEDPPASPGAAVRDLYMPIIGANFCLGCYYVDGVKGSDLRLGTSPDQAWRTIQKAANTVTPGSIVTVFSGNYSERVLVTRPGITFRAEGAVVMRGFTIKADYISIIGFEITNTADDWEDGYGIWVKGSNCILEGNYIHYATRGGIRLYAQIGEAAGTSHCTVRNNRLYRNTSTGIEVHGRDHLVEGNEIWGNIQYHPNWENQPRSGLVGIRFFGSGHIIRGNYIHDISYYDPENIDPHIDCFHTWSGENFEVGHDIIFEGNICVCLEALAEHKFGIGFMLEGGASNITIRNNIIRAYEVINAANSPSLKVINNTMTNDLSLPKDYYPSIISLSGSPNAFIKNNIIYDPQEHVVYLADDQSKQGLEVGYNCVYRSDGKKPWGSPYPHDLWQVNPLFVDPERGDFHLLPASPAVDTGIPLQNVFDDLEGKPRPLGKGYDMGAYER